MKRLNIAFLAAVFALFLFSSCGTNRMNDDLEGDGVTNSMSSGSEEEGSEDNGNNGSAETDRQPVENNGDDVAEPVGNKRWVNVGVILKGKKNRKTKSFKVKEKQWKIAWKVDKKTADDEFIVIKHPKKDPEETEIVVNNNGDTDGESDIMTDKGEFVFDVTAKGDWEITLQEYK